MDSWTSGRPIQRMAHALDRQFSGSIKPNVLVCYNLRCQARQQQAQQAHELREARRRLEQLVGGGGGGGGRGRRDQFPLVHSQDEGLNFDVPFWMVGRKSQFIFFEARGFRTGRSQRPCEPRDCPMLLQENKVYAFYTCLCTPV